VQLAHVGSFVPAQHSSCAKLRVQQHLQPLLLFLWQFKHPAGCAAGLPRSCGQLCACAACRGETA
jgi:hypothetical protein